MARMSGVASGGETGDPLTTVAQAVEDDDGLAAEMAEWDATVGDGFEPDAAWVEPTARV